MYLKKMLVESYGEYPRKSDFDSSTNCVTSLYFSCLPKKVDTSPFQKVIVVAVDSEPKKTYEDMVDVVAVYVFFDFEAYWADDKIGRKRRILTLIHDGLSALIREFGWTADAFALAHQEVQKRNFVHRGFWKKPVPNRTKELKAQLYIDFDCDQIRVDAVIMRKGGEEVLREYLTSVRPHWFYVEDTLGPIAWSDDATAVISTRDKKQTWLLRAKD